MSNETKIIVCNNEKSIGEIPRPIWPRDGLVCVPIPGYLSAFLPCTDAIFIDDAPATKNPYAMSRTIVVLVTLQLLLLVRWDIPIGLWFSILSVCHDVTKVSVISYQKSEVPLLFLWKQIGRFLHFSAKLAYCLLVWEPAFYVRKCTSYFLANNCNQSGT